ncbi:tyrosine-protein phosphatase siw14 [Yamadazyma tenuis]|uniref:diphosphoinositol-polyphosphate diphosphatase n=1 Tax=Candida tenuis (strain ATCC 10573 / BCRC 21748 / CBS 615 / JCM 9827 / NBRC 10315 / NRRL Y-1498 / VKM Y-70) TaxID=590646 RepID=G3BFJ5_CANTC|nr:uncharacterized protein CANTEDRAFT_128215 [Yamadazyma tenuis ATCC 10573]EGV60705.1 hypothetical protein CANTEDRAFT_128215 [Yamadazyma tenuis ATCC 10573]WEJ94029.1 tyrosine-protein phosphatase siw14 [Yamadazyma tenuis]
MGDFSEDPFQMDDDFSASLHIASSYSDPIDNFTAATDQAQIRSRLAVLDLEQFPEDADDAFDEGEHKKATEMAQASLVNQPNHPLTPPENFAPVVNNIYRSSFPQTTNFSFLERLKLKSILCLIPEDYPDTHHQFLKNQDIKLFQLGLSGNKEPFVVISHELITEALKIVLDPANQPILIHCNRGKHRTGCVVGILRRLQQWSLTIIFDEYRRFAAPKERPMDQQFIELYNQTEIVSFCQERNYLPLSWD